MNAILKEILEPSGQDAFDHLTRMETSSINTFENSRAEHAQHSANVGLPGHIIQCHHTCPAYTTYTAPVVKMLMEQDGWRRAAAACPAHTDPSRASPPAGSVGTAPVPPAPGGGSGCPRGAEGSVGKSTAGRSLPSPSVCSRVIFARKPPSRVAPCGSLVRSSRKK